MEATGAHAAASAAEATTTAAATPRQCIVRNEACSD
jgi:hypothetical protein